jgi:hypothetical protein
MKGNDRVRFCSQCKLSVYNISAMPEDEALSLIREHEGRLCVRLYRRVDGKVLAKNCPKGVAAMRRRLAQAICVVFAVMFGAFSAGMASLNPPERHKDLIDEARDWPLVGALVNSLVPPEHGFVMGKLSAAAPSPSASVSSTSSVP